MKLRYLQIASSICITCCHLGMSHPALASQTYKMCIRDRMNTPTRLAEASGTSGEKALMNGVLKDVYKRQADKDEAEDGIRDSFR